MPRHIYALILIAVVCASIVAMCSGTAKAETLSDDRFLFAGLAGEVTGSIRCAPPIICRDRVRHQRKWKRRKVKPVQVRPAIRSPARAIIVRAVRIPVPRNRPDAAPEADEDEAATNAVWARIAASLRPVGLPAVDAKPQNLFHGFARELARALPSRSLAGVVPTLAAKAQELVTACGSRVISGKRQTYVAGTRRISLHASGRAVDMGGNPSCMYALLRRWPGGVSVDYARVRHVHISYSPKGREWGARFAHRGGTKRTRYARRVGRRA